MEIKKFKMFEDGEGGGVATASLGNSAGMGDVVAPQPGATPGTTGTIGSGDLPAYDMGKYFGTKPKRKKKYSTKERHVGTNTSKESMYVTSFTDWLQEDLNEKSKSKSQQRLFGMAYSVRTGKMDKKDANDAVLKIVNSDISDKDILDFAETNHENIPQKVNENIEYDDLLYFVNKIANIGLYPTPKEFWGLVEEARNLL